MHKAVLQRDRLRKIYLREFLDLISMRVLVMRLFVQDAVRGCPAEELATVLPVIRAFAEAQLHVVHRIVKGFSKRMSVY